MVDVDATGVALFVSAVAAAPAKQYPLYYALPVQCNLVIEKGLALYKARLARLETFGNDLYHCEKWKEACVAEFTAHQHDVQLIVSFDAMLHPDESLYTTFTGQITREASEPVSVAAEVLQFAADTMDGHLLVPALLVCAPSADLYVTMWTMCPSDASGQLCQSHVASGRVRAAALLSDGDDDIDTNVEVTMCSLDGTEVAHVRLHTNKGATAHTTLETTLAFLAKTSPVAYTHVVKSAQMPDVSECHLLASSSDTDDIHFPTDMRPACNRMRSMRRTRVDGGWYAQSKDGSCHERIAMPVWMQAVFDAHMTSADLPTVAVVQSLELACELHGATTSQFREAVNALSENRGKELGMDVRTLQRIFVSAIEHVKIELPYLSDMTLTSGGKGRLVLKACDQWQSSLSAPDRDHPAGDCEDSTRAILAVVYGLLNVHKGGGGGGDANLRALQTMATYYVPLEVDGSIHSVPSEEKEQSLHAFVQLVPWAVLANSMAHAADGALVRKHPYVKPRLAASALLSTLHVDSTAFVDPLLRLVDDDDSGDVDVDEVAMERALRSLRVVDRETDAKAPWWLDMLHMPQSMRRLQERGYYRFIIAAYSAVLFNFFGWQTTLFVNDVFGAPIDDWLRPQTTVQLLPLDRMGMDEEHHYAAFSSGASKADVHEDEDAQTNVRWWNTLKYIMATRQLIPSLLPRGAVHASPDLEKSMAAAFSPTNYKPRPRRKVLLRVQLILRDVDARVMQGADLLPTLREEMDAYMKARGFVRETAPKAVITYHGTICRRILYIKYA
jgi:hypothetical protein